MTLMANQKGKVLVAMSGGVDSSVAAYLLREAGYEVTGLFLRLGDGMAGAFADACRVAGALGIELISLDVEADFARIIDYFVDEYARGRTPNPCIRCNTLIKFARLIEQADALGARYIATGHHARMIDGHICRAAEKDQSYALFGIPRGRLGRILLPIGELADKAEVRRIAAELGLAAAEKPDSQEICFVSGDYVDLLRARRCEALRPGDIVDSAGSVLGRHDGVAKFTIGQRRGLGVAAGQPLYVTRIDPSSATVTVGPKAEVMSRHLSASDANWHVDTNKGWHGQVGAKRKLGRVESLPRPSSTLFRLTVPPSVTHTTANLPLRSRLTVPPTEFDATVQIRYNHAGAPGRVRITAPDRFEVEFAEPVAAITPGQAAVVYDGQTLLGGGWIENRD